MTDTEKTNASVKVLKEEMKWEKKANNTPTILDVLEFIYLFDNFEFKLPDLSVSIPIKWCVLYKSHKGAAP